MKDNANQLIILRASLAGEVRRITHDDGKEYLIVPAVAIVEGVLNGEFVPGTEIGAFVEAWNGIPVTLGHPRDEHGRYISANDPAVIANASPGRLWHADFDGRRLRGEIWISVEDAERIGGEALEAVHRFEAGIPVELSTGYYRNYEPANGIFNGEQYSSVAHDIRPDHLAILLHDLGACSWDDGCGAPRTNRRNGMPPSGTAPNPQAPPGPNVYVANVKLSLDDQRMLVVRAWRKLFDRAMEPIPVEDQPTFWIVDVFADELIVRNEEGKMWSYGYAIDEQGEVTFQDPIRVEVIYQPLQTNRRNATSILRGVAEHLGLGGLFQNSESTEPDDSPAGEPDTENNSQTEEDRPMSTTQLIEQLTANAACPFGKKALEGMTADELKALQDLLRDEAPAPSPERDEPGAGPAPAPAPAKDEAAPPRPSEVGQPAANAGQENPPAQDLTEVTALARALKDLGGVEVLAGALSTIKANAEQEEKALIDAIVANSNLTAEDLAGLGLERLRKLHDAFAGTQSAADFSGRPLPDLSSNAGSGGERWVSKPMPKYGQPAANGAGQQG